MSSSEKKHKDIYDISMREEEIVIGGDDYILREANEDAVRRFRNGVLNGVTMGPAGKPSKVKDVADLDSILLSDCLFRSTNGEISKKSVPVATIRSWPRRVVKELVKKVRAMSDFGDEEMSEEEEGNS